MLRSAAFGRQGLIGAWSVLDGPAALAGHDFFAVDVHDAVVRFVVSPDRHLRAAGGRKQDVDAAGGLRLRSPQAQPTLLLVLVFEVDSPPVGSRLDFAAGMRLLVADSVFGWILGFSARQSNSARR
jgi:hypothetical protein